MRGDPIDLTSPSYTPNRLLDKVAEMLHIQNDATLALVLECDPAMICRVRSRKDPVSPWLMVQIMDRTGWHITYVRELAGIPYDGVAKIVMLAQHIGKRFPRMWTAEQKTSVDIRRSA